MEIDKCAKCGSVSSIRPVLNPKKLCSKCWLLERDDSGEKSNIESLVIEKLSQLENCELDDCPSGKKLAEEIKKNSKFVEMYEDYKRKNY